MADEEPTLASVIDELQPLVGGRIQRVDVVAEREVVIEVRVPQRTLCLLLSARTKPGLLGLIERRPAREIPGGQLQASLRTRLAGQPLIALRLDGRTVTVATRRACIDVNLSGGKSAFAFRPGVDAPRVDGPDADRSSTGPIPDAFPIAEAVGRRHVEHGPEARVDVLRRGLGRALGAKRRKLSRLVRNIEGDRDRLASFLDAVHRGELLKAELHRVRRGQREVTVTDWTTGQPIVVPLDPALTPQQNLVRLFDRAKKGRRGLPLVEARLSRIQASLTEIEARLAALPSASQETLSAWAEGSADALEGAVARSTAGAARKARAHPLDAWSRRFVAVDGTEIRVGKGAKANDRLTFTGAKGDDFWLHARGTTGAHVVLKNAKGRTPSPESLLDAAHLAAHFSSARTDSKVEVIYTEARHVKKVKGAPAGQVGISKSKTMLVRMDASRLDRLLLRGDASLPQYSPGG